MTKFDPLQSVCITCNHFINRIFMGLNSNEEWMGEKQRVAGICDKPESDHYGHVLIGEHPTCDFVTWKDFSCDERDKLRKDRKKSFRKNKKFLQELEERKKLKSNKKELIK